MSQLTDNLTRLLRPKNIAVVGGHFAQAVAKQCQKMDFRGEIWPVHPNRETLAGLRCYKDIESLPNSPDATFIGVNRHQTIEIVKQLQGINAGGAVCYASGFKETGSDELNDQLILSAEQMPVLGPNCYGFINYLDGALLWPDQHGGKRVDSGVAVLMQSSNIAINLTMNKRATPIAYMIALGNQAMVGMSDMIRQLCLDERVTAIGLHIEALDDLGQFCDAIYTAHQHRKPVVILKTGKSDKGAAITLTHTASLASDDNVMNALFDRLGVARVESLSQFLETLKLLHVYGALPSNDLVSMSCSGGEASLISDAAENFSVEFKDFSAKDLERIKPTVHDLVAISNPFDYHTFDWADYEKLKATFTAVMNAGVSLNLLVMDFPREDRCDIDDWRVSMAAWLAASQKTGARAAIVASLAESMPEDIAQELIESKIIPFCGIENTLAAVEAASKIDAKTAKFEPFEVCEDSAVTPRMLDEFTSKKELAEFSIPIPMSKICSSKEQALNIAKQINYPLVVKAVGENLAHKTELGAVKLNLQDDQQLATAIDELSQCSDKFLIEQMIPNIRTELIIGVNKDPVIGLYLVIGAGGIFTELLNDSKVLLFPYTPSQVESALQDLKVCALLDGYRSQAAIDKRQLIDCLLNIQAFVKANKTSLMEMDINPLIVCNDAKVFAADALIRKRQS